ncbi:MAG: peptide chain release factor-like protein [Candidatus Omnitrophota bacterium]
MPGSGVGIHKENALKREMSRLGIRPEDITESFIRSSGPGGQNVNKTSTCVYLKHLPTGIEVRCQKERVQALNRYFARKLLLKKIEARILKKLSEERGRVEKLRRQKRKRPRGLKLRILEDKRKRAQKKIFRQRVREIE